MAAQPSSVRARLPEWFAAAPSAATARRTGVVPRPSQIAGQLLRALVPGGGWRPAVPPLAPWVATATPCGGRWRRTPCLHACTHALWAVSRQGGASPWPRATPGPLAERPGVARPDSRHDTFPGAGGPPKRGRTVHACGMPTTGAAPVMASNSLRRETNTARTAWSLP